ncbi:hypothetical protein CA85_52650 [Allorhodopirellula solitaria]|uniref:Uncharacterized protein n=1 Tax=Allorhodopirellula solitaria TaxID=2527987 RepID=A0A5C5WJD2_9BACT|nr:hypothetical protein CA85_52650 [Allorhodopirellula solitaria]
MASRADLASGETLHHFRRVTAAINGDGRATFTCQDVNAVLHCMALLFAWRWMV